VLSIHKKTNTVRLLPSLDVVAVSQATKATSEMLKAPKMTQKAKGIEEFGKTKA
jgi:hypothetical protein